MSLKKCIDAALQANVITSDEADDLAKEYDRLVKRGTSNKGARADLADMLSKEAQDRKRRAAKAEVARQKLEEFITTHTAPNGENDPFTALMMVLEREAVEGRIDDVRSRQAALHSIVHARMAKLIDEFAGGGVANKVMGDAARRLPWQAAKADNIVRELAKEGSTGDESARLMANVWRDTSEFLRQSFNAAGGNIAKLETWMLPQHHNLHALNKVSAEKWIDYIMPLLDRDRMVNQVTGRRMDDDELRDALLVVHETIRTDGWSQRDPSSRGMGRGALFNRHTDHRFLHFKDADSWLKYQKDFGDGDVFATMTGHINSMVRDIAFMEVMGPNPHAMFDYMKALVQNQVGPLTAGSPDRARKIQQNARSALYNAQNMFDIMRGASNMPVHEVGANISGGLRNVATASKLGSAFISAIGDLSFSKVAREMAGMPADHVFRRTITAYLSQFGPGRQQMAVEAGLMLDSAMHVTQREARFAAATDFTGITGYMADRVLWASMLSPHTQAAKHGFGLDLQRHVVNNREIAYDKLTPEFRRALQLSNIDSAMWDTIRQTTPFENGGAKFIRPQELEAIDEEAARRYFAMIYRFTRQAVPEPSVRARAWMYQGTRPGTIGGEGARLAMQFKGFSVGLMFLTYTKAYDDILRAGGNWKAPASRTAGLLINLMLMGALSLQLKELASGRDPRSMDNAAFWGAAFMQGGGLGIYGDFLFADVNRFGGGLPSTLAGPVIGSLVDPLRNLLIGNAQQSVLGDDTNAGRELYRFLRANTPGSSLWYAKLALDRTMWESLQRTLDPKAHQAWRRQVRSRQRDYGQQYWWAPGQRSPSRAPDAGAIVSQ